MRYEEVGLFQNVKWSHAQAIANTAIKEFLGGDMSSVYLVYNEFQSIMAQRVVVERLLPIAKLAATENADGTLVGQAATTSTISSSRRRKSCSTRFCRSTSRCR